MALLHLNNKEIIEQLKGQFSIKFKRVKRHPSITIIPARNFNWKLNLFSKKKIPEDI